MITNTPFFMKLVFLHYFGGSALSWQYVTEQLSPEADCLPLDVPGFGDVPALSDQQTVDDMADALIGPIKAWVAGEPFILVGHSMGGKIAMALAAGTSDRPVPAGLRALVLVATSPPSPEPIPDKSRQQMLDRPDQTGPERQQIAEQTADQIIRLPVGKAIRQLVVSDNLRASTEAWVAWAAVGSREDITDRLSRITIPVSMLAGDQDKAVPQAVQFEQVLPWLPNAGLRTVEGGGHLLPLEAPNEVVAVIRDLLPTAQ